MIYVRYSEDPEEIELEADQDGLVVLSSLLSKGCGSIETDIPTVSSDPYDEYLNRIRIEIGEGLVSISRQAGMLEIRGSSEPLSALARNLDYLTELLKDPSLDPIRHHLHIEPYPENPFLDNNSTPLILQPSKENS